MADIMNIYNQQFLSQVLQLLDIYLVISVYQQRLRFLRLDGCSFAFLSNMWPKRDSVSVWVNCIDGGLPSFKESEILHL